MLSLEEIVDMRKKLAGLSHEQLRVLPHEELLALVVNLREALERAERIRSGEIQSEAQDLDRLMT
jgi:predicted RNA-binding Zn ribbon-like protein